MAIGSAGVTPVAGQVTDEGRPATPQWMGAG